MNDLVTWPLLWGAPINRKNLSEYVAVTMVDGLNVEIFLFVVERMHLKDLECVWVYFLAHSLFDTILFVKWKIF